MTIPTYEERQAAELTNLREWRKSETDKREALEARLAQLTALLTTPLSDEQADVQAFGRGAWVYCRQHVKPHLTGWCSIPAYDKIGLGVDNAEAAYAKCEAWGLKIFDYNKKD